MDIVKECIDKKFLNGIESIILRRAKEKRWDEAREWLVEYELLTKCNKSPEVLFIKSLFALNQNSFESAESLMKKAFEMTKNEVHCHIRWSNELRFHYFFRFAGKILKWSIVINPNEIDLLINYSSVLHEMNETDQASKYEKIAHDLDPTNKEALFYYKKGAIHEYLPDASEYTFNYDESAVNIKKALIDHGFVLVKNIPQRDQIDKFLCRLKSNINETMEHSKCNGQDINVPLHFLAKDGDQKELIKCFIANKHKPLGVWHWEFNKVINIKDVWSFFEGFHEVKLGVAGFLGGDVHAVESLGYARQKSYAEKTLPMHQDARTGYWDKNRVVFWCPLTSCGKNSPGVEVIPWRFKNFFPIKLYSPEDLRKRNYYGYHSSINDNLYPKDIILSPILEPGDLLLFDTFTLHRTQWMDKVEDTRYNLDIRFETI